MRYHGGKFMLAPWIVKFFPPHHRYVEPYGGAANVLLCKQKSPREIYNEMNGEVSNVFSVLRDPAQADYLSHLCYLTPYSRKEYTLSFEKHSDPVEQARRTIYRSWALFSPALFFRGTGFTSAFRNYSGKSINVVDGWNQIHRAVRVFAERMRCVMIESIPALDLIKRCDHEDTLIYLDPPYLLSERETQKAYLHEMSDEDHIELLNTIKQSSAMIVLSGYDNCMYRDLLSGWYMEQKNTSKSSNGGSVQSKECLWINPRCQTAALKKHFINQEIHKKTYL